MNLYPSILTDSFDDLQSKISSLQELKSINTAKIDIIDGVYADNITVGIMDLASVDFGRIKADLHMMVEEPMDYVVDLISVKDRIPLRAVVAQIEKMSFQADFIEEVKKNGWLAGLSLDLYTPLEEIEDESWDLVDIVQLMSIDKIGFQGTSDFKEIIIKKTRELFELARSKGRRIEIIIDGGINLDNAPELISAGATGLEVGKALWQAKDLSETVDGFMRLEK